MDELVGRCFVELRHTHLEALAQHRLALVHVSAIGLDAPEGGHDLEGVACLLALQLETVRVLLGEQLVRLVILLHAVEEGAEVVDRVERREVLVAKDLFTREVNVGHSEP